MQQRLHGMDLGLERSCRHIGGADKSQPEASLHELLRQGWKYLEDHRKYSTAIREIFLALADGQPPAQSSCEDPTKADLNLSVPPSELTDDDATAVGDLLPLDWRVQVPTLKTKLRLCFLTQLLELFLCLDEQSDSCFGVSWLELIFMPSFVEQVVFPVCNINTGLGISRADLIFDQAPQTVAVQLRLVKDAFRSICSKFQLQLSQLDGLNLFGCGVTFPLTGIVLKCPAEQVWKARPKLAAFCEARPAQDLARPC